jgi:hypothetical protein
VIRQLDEIRAPKSGRFFPWHPASGHGLFGVAKSGDAVRNRWAHFGTTMNSSQRGMRVRTSRFDGLSQV